MSILSSGGIMMAEGQLNRPAPQAPRFATGPEAAQGDAYQQTRDKMRQFVGETFYGALMQQFQKGLDQHNPMSGGRGEEIFRGELNQVLVRRLAARSHFPMADFAADAILKNTPYSKVVSPERAGISVKA